MRTRCGSEHRDRALRDSEAMSEKRQVDEALRDTEARIAALFHEAPRGYQSLDEEGRFLDVNAAWLETLGYDRDKVIGRWFGDFLAPEFVESFRKRFPLFKERGATHSEFQMMHKSGERRFIAFEGRIEHGRDGSFLRTHCVLADISESKRAEAKLLERERELSTLMGNLPGMAYRCSNDRLWTVHFVSAGCLALTGYPPEALVDNAVVAYGSLVSPEDAARLWGETQAAIEAGAPWTCVYRITTASGELRWVWERGVALTTSDGDVVLEGFVQDVTEARKTEARLEAASAEWRRTFDAMGDSVAVFDHGGRLLRCNRATAEVTGRDFADLIGRPCYEVFHGTDDYHESCPQRLALVSGREETSFFEQNGRWLRVTFEPQVDDAGRVTGGVHVVSDVTELKESEKRLRASVSKQQRISEGVIAALSRSIEVRDPYTAGHERRVSQLATAIARRMGLDEAAVKRVEVAGMLHDVGKIVVPAEILSKPGRLSETEFALIKGHPKTAHSILAPIEFDFPLAEIVLQHHERLDGSGYPAGLAEGDILLEARILAVADVTEAMISHRPYRAALPLEAATAELESGAGTRYDAVACETTLRLFRREGFTFSE